ncbi:hypothetical protein BCR34DRAFT_593944 [Clohesyomyces aquaticus]|uniref:Acyclic terpene utilisation N-terminal domain-containing protein n=1 Tax=Clohesyomyces aquaticus TaxID=1231657 RepID=A0A1Y1YDU8_9PLEO|nr:hypothetical protein BCR34DRAFT_593944 [Clohesyomyces aquaticus]
MSSNKRPIRVAGASGGYTDRQRAIHDLAKECDVDVITGDWMAEGTMVMHGVNKTKKLQDPDAANGPCYDPYFLGTLDPALPVLAEKGVKLAVNAGASDPGLLAKEVADRCRERGLNLKVAYIEGDECIDQIKELQKKGDPLRNMDTGKALKDWGFEPIYAQAYLGSFGIAEAFRKGADIVIAGRVADAAPTVGAAIWWHGWDRSNLDELAGALMAGHIIECSAYATGGYYAGFKGLMDKCENLGFPIAAIEATGDTVFTKGAGPGGEMSVGTATSQLLYEIQGPSYFNSDVVANIEGITLTQVGKDEVRMTGVKGLPPPPTTKVGITSETGKLWQAEFHFFFVGLDIEEKSKWTEKQIRYAMRDHIHKFTALKFHCVGSAASDADSQDAATVDFRVFAQTKDPSIVGAGGSPAGIGLGTMTTGTFVRWCLENFLQSCPGATVEVDTRQSIARPILEYWPTIMPQNLVQERMVLEWNGEAFNIPGPTETREHGPQRSYEPQNPVQLKSFGPTTRKPLGFVALGRSGDKASDADVGFFVRKEDEWDWLRSLLSTETFIKLLGKEYLGNRIDRCELPGVKAVHFLLKDHLDRGSPFRAHSYT